MMMLPPNPNVPPNVPGVEVVVPWHSIDLDTPPQAPAVTLPEFNETTPSTSTTHRYILLEF